MNNITDLNSLIQAYNNNEITLEEVAITAFEAGWDAGFYDCESAQFTTFTETSPEDWSPL